MSAVLRGRDEALKILHEKHNFDMKLGFIAIVSRDLGYKAAQDTVDFVKKYRQHFVGFDFAASEDAAPAPTWVPIVQQVRALNLKLTVHSGEGSSANHIREVIDLYNPERLGHGTFFFARCLNPANTLRFACYL